MDRLVKCVSNFLFLHSGPIALGILMWRFTDYQDLVITSWHFFVFIVDSYLVWLTVLAFKKNKDPDQPLPDKLRIPGRLAILHKIACEAARFLKSLRPYGRHLLTSRWSLVTTMLVVWQLIFVFWFVLAEDFSTTWAYVNGRSVTSPHWIATAEKKIKDKYPQLFSLITPTIALDPNKSVWLPSKQEIELRAAMAGERDFAKWWLQYGEGLSLTGRHLRGFTAQRAYLPKLRLDKNSDLQGADLSGAQLQGAVLSGAKLKGAILDTAQLQGAQLILTQLQGASLSMAKLQGADLFFAKLQGANLSMAELQGANLNVAELSGADLYGAQLQGANLAAAQLQGANLSNIGSDPNSEDDLKENEVFRGAALQGTNLSSTYMHGAILNETAFYRNSLPSNMQVSFVYPNDSKRQAYSLYDINWEEVKSYSRLVPYKSLEGFLYRVNEIAKFYPINSTMDLKKAFSNSPEVVWKLVIPNWDGVSVLLNQDDQLFAARGLRNNYENVFGNKNKSDRYHPEYLEEINRAFCNSKNFQSLCEKR